MRYSLPSCFDSLPLFPMRLENVACPSISRQQEQYLRLEHILFWIFCSCCWAPAPRQLFKISFKLLPSTLPGLCWTCCFLVCELVNFCSPADEVVVAAASTQKRFKRPRSQRLPRGVRDSAGQTSHIMDTQSLCRHLNISHMQRAQPPTTGGTTCGHMGRGSGPEESQPPNEKARTWRLPIVWC